MKVQIRKVWSHFDYTSEPKRFKYVNVVARDDKGVDHLLISFDAWMASLCLQYERKSSTSEVQPPAVELIVNDKGKILELREAAA